MPDEENEMQFTWAQGDAYKRAGYKPRWPLEFETVYRVFANETVGYVYDVHNARTWGRVVRKGRKSFNKAERQVIMDMVRIRYG